MTKRIILKTLEWTAAAIIIAAMTEGGSWMAMYLGVKHRR